MTKRKIVRIIARLNIGGPAIHTVLLTRGFNNDKWESLLIAGLESADEGSMREWAAAQGVDPLILPELGREIQFGSDLRALWALIRLLRREKPDIVHTHTAKAGFIGRTAAFLTGVPVIVHTFHGHVFHSYFGATKTKLFILIERLLARVTTRIVVISPQQKREIVGFGIAPPDKFTIIPLGFDLSPFLTSTRHHGGLRAELGLPADAEMVGIVARITAVKNHHFFLRAAAQLLADGHTNLHFLIIGDGELRPELETQAEIAGISKNVHFLGWRRDLPFIYADLDLVALTSHNEGTPVTLIEAQAAACPVVATAVGGVPDIVADGISGVLTPPGDISAFANGILRALAADKAEMGRAGQTAVSEKFSVDRLIHDINALYESVL